MKTLIFLFIFFSSPYFSFNLSAQIFADSEPKGDSMSVNYRLPAIEVISKRGIFVDYRFLKTMYLRFEANSILNAN